MNTPPTDPLELLKSLWSSVGMPLPGLVTPTLDTNELDKRITDLKAVEGWLKTNLGMLQMTIQGLEVQRATLAAIQALQRSDGSADANANLANLFTNPTLWPWNLVQPAPSAASGSAAIDAARTPQDDGKPAQSTPKPKSK